MPVPPELKHLPQWVTWKLETVDGRPTKVPYKPGSQDHAAVDDPTTWASATAAFRATTMNGSSGLGFVLTADDPFCGIDLDHCRDPQTGALEDWAQRIVDRFQSYTEVTPSLTGVRIWIRGDKHGERCRKSVGPDGRRVEIYDRDRYYTTTGQGINDAWPSIEHRQEELDALYAELFPPRREQAAHQPAAAPRLSDYDIIQKARIATNGALFESLMRGDTSRYSGDDSAADLALCNLLAFYTDDADQLDRIFRTSGLSREKWNRQDYRERTIAKALDEAIERYKPSPPIRHGEGNPFRVVDTGTPQAGWLRPLGELLEQPEEEIDWLLDGWLMRGGLHMMGAKPKVGKSTLLRQLALAVATGDTFFDRKTRQGPVIYLALEGHRVNDINEFRALGACSDTAPPIHILIGTAPDKALEQLALAIQETHAVLAIIDPIQRLMKLEDLNDYAQVSNATDPLISLSRNTGCTVLFSHHLGKLDREGGDQILGSTAIFGSVDGAFIVRKNQDKMRIVETIQRVGDQLEETVIGFDPTTKRSHLAGGVEEYEQEQLRRAILAVLKDAAGDPMTLDEVTEATGRRAQPVGRELGRLTASHHVIRTGRGVKNSPYLFVLARYAESREPNGGGNRIGKSESDSAVPRVSLSVPPTGGTERKENPGFGSPVPEERCYQAERFGSPACGLHAMTLDRDGCCPISGEVLG